MSTGARLAPIVLALETSGRLAGAAVAAGTDLLGEVEVDARRARTERLLEDARRLLDELSLGIERVAFVAFSEGPGSFTGLRVGMAAALALAAAREIPAVPVPTLETIAFPWRLWPGPLVVVSGHRRGQVYGALYRWTMDDRFHAEIEPVSRPDQEFLDACAGRAAGGGTGERLLFVGDALDSLADSIQRSFGDRARLGGTEPPRAAHVARLALDPARPRWTKTELEGRNPLYLRDADARRPGRSGRSG
ncbi:MAG: tRNA (adenosine(37)-N6)-threonylcarbamoyltransferase complex dimerization subunit type 1 TsaB [Candidatus Eisenbacteria bacterium]